MQVKRKIVRDAILTAAEQEFSENGYVKATINKIAVNAGTSPSNVYVYFPSKLDIALAVFEPWFKRRILALEQSVADEANIEQKLKCLLEGLWEHIPGDDNGLTATLIQALATATPQDPYNHTLLQWTEEMIAKMLSGIMPQESQSKVDFLAIAHMIMFVFDGVGLRRNLRQPLDRRSEMISELVAIISRMSVPIKD